MNYLERLIRRALLQPAQGTGETIYDPFEREATWDLETPVDAVPRHSPTPPSPQDVAPGTPPVAPVSAPPFPEAVGQGTELAERVEIAMDAVPTTWEQRAPVREKGLAEPPSIADSLSPPVPAHKPVELSEALSQADQFMRSLHRPSPQWIGEAAQTPSQPSVTPLQPIPPQQPEWRTVSDEVLVDGPAPLILPPAPSIPLREVSFSKQKKDEPMATGNKSFVSRVGDAQAAIPPNQVVSPAPQVIVVQTGEKENGIARIGAGAPYFGLGQL